jgi:CBS domain-containing protein
MIKRRLVKDWMSRSVVTVTPDTSLGDAHQLMLEKRIRRLPVIDQGHLVGIVTRGDVRQADPSKVTSLSTWEVTDLVAKIKVGQMMTPKPAVIAQEATIGEAAQTMLAKKISGLPVVDDEGQLVGIITESDIFRMVVNEWSKE